MVTSVFVLGAGSFGTCLSCYLAKVGHNVTLWSRSAATVRSINEKRFNDRYLSSVRLPTNITATTDISAIADAQLVLLTVPTQALRGVLQQIERELPAETLIVSTLKGIELETKMFPRQILGDVLGEERAQNLVSLSGPSFAIEVAEGQPCCVSAAGYNEQHLLQAQEMLHTPALRVYTANDPVGLEIAGVYKNVIAVASGACAGAGFGANSQASLITRGLAEMLRFGRKKGANPVSFLGLCGVGDLFMTCTSEKSRNYTLGYNLGAGKSKQEAVALLSSVAEGIPTSAALHFLAKNLEISTPIVDEVYYVLYEDKSVKKAIKDLMHREAKPEIDWLSR